VEKVYKYEKEEGWRHIVLETTDGHLIPLRYFSSAKSNSPVAILCYDSSKDGKEKMIINGYIQKGYSVAVADVWGTGELSSADARKTDGRLPEFHTLARSELWLGHTIMGEWVSDINTVINFIQSAYKPFSVIVDAQRELAIAALMQSTLNNNVDTCVLRICPLSYALDKRDGIDFFNMAIHLPGILKWGDISLAAALNTHTKLIFRSPVSVTGERIKGQSLLTFKEKFSLMEAACKNENKIVFTE
jgi:hypothetical protein